MLYQDNTAKLVGLKDVIVKQVDEEKNRHSITIELPRKVHECPQCGCQTRAIHDYRMLNIRDLNAFGKQTILRLRKRRYRCPDCGKRFYGEIPFLPKYYKVTNRLAANLINMFRESRTATQFARENGVSVTSALRQFSIVKFTFKCLPEVLSMDEFRGYAGGERFQTILTDPAEP